MKQHIGPVLIRAVLAAPFLAVLLAAAGQCADAKTVGLLHYWTGALSGGVNDLVTAHNKGQSEYAVSATGMEHESFKTGIKRMLVSGGGPDIFSYWAGARTRYLVEHDLLEPIDDVWDKAGLRGVFTPAVAGACSYGGRMYAVPVTQHYVAFFYNKKVFASLGIPPPATWERFLAACEKIKAAGIAPIALGAKEQWPAQFWYDYLLLRTAGPDLRRELMEGRASFAGPESARAFALWKDLLDRKLFNAEMLSLDWAGAAREVQNGRAAMTLMGTWIIGLYGGALGWAEEADYDFFAFPVIEPSVPLVGVGPIDVLLMSRKQGLDGVKDALAYFAGIKPQEEMSRGSGALAPSTVVPEGFYSPMRRRILQEVKASSGWAFAYDLAVPPEVADIGLGAFTAFLRNPERMAAILQGAQARMAVYYAAATGK
jgi:multiple sugar transport system substrate-binding protein/raffinose/stachyose/melibiose transport system substrate-binding protein